MRFGYENTTDMTRAIKRQYIGRNQRLPSSSTVQR
jgi:hypothetical protein